MIFIKLILFKFRFIKIFFKDFYLLNTNFSNISASERVVYNFFDIFVLLHPRSNIQRLHSLSIDRNFLLSFVAVRHQNLVGIPTQEILNWKMALRCDVTTFHSSLCNVSLHRPLPPFQLGKCGFDLRPTYQRGIRSLPSSTTAMPTHFLRQSAKVSGKLAICQQQTPPWSQCDDWRPKRRPPRGRKLRTASVHRSMHITLYIQVSLSNHISLWQLI